MTGFEPQTLDVENTHLRGNDHWNSLTGLDLTKQGNMLFFVPMCLNYLIQTSQTGDQLYLCDYSPYGDCSLSGARINLSANVCLSKFKLFFLS